VRGQTRLPAGGRAAGQRAEILTPRLFFHLVDPEVALRVLDGERPPGLKLADGYPSMHSHDVMRLAAQGGSSRDVGPFFVVRSRDRAVIGEIGCRLDRYRRTAHVGYTIVEPCWNRGYATEALVAVADHLLHVVGVPRVAAETGEGHLASRRVMEKAGLRLAARRSPGDVGRGVVLGRPPAGDLVSYEAILGLWSAPPPRQWGGGLRSVARAEERRASSLVLRRR
jgi:RimJ/RimL family protein N-acetyltransferase